MIFVILPSSIHYLLRAAVQYLPVMWKRGGRSYSAKCSVLSSYCCKNWSKRCVATWPAWDVTWSLSWVQSAERCIMYGRVSEWPLMTCHQCLQVWETYVKRPEVWCSSCKRGCLEARAHAWRRLKASQESDTRGSSWSAPAGCQVQRQAQGRPPFQLLRTSWALNSALTSPF